jgi:hypothetical protein
MADKLTELKDMLNEQIELLQDRSITGYALEINLDKAWRIIGIVKNVIAKANENFSVSKRRRI